jgi:hypothetical protein
MYIILGDSWGCGEWVDGEVTHSGLAFYMEELGHKVVNNSIPGGSNYESLNSLKDFLVCEQDLEEIKKINGIFLFWTEWYRDFRIKPYGIFDLAVDSSNYFMPKNYNKDFYSRYQERVLLDFKKVADKLKVPIYVIGGASDLDYFDNDLFGNVICVCQSLTNLCVNNSDRIQDPARCTARWPVEFVKTIKQNTKTSLEFLLDELQKNENRQNLCKEYRLQFFPDKAHVDRKGHKKLLNLLIEKKILNESKD